MPAPCSTFSVSWTNTRLAFRLRDGASRGLAILRPIHRPGVARVCVWITEHSGLDIERLCAPGKLSGQQHQRVDPLFMQDLDLWQDLLTWFRDRFPYNRAACACGAHGELLGNVHASPREAAFRASRTELQHCGTCGSITRFPRCMFHVSASNSQAKAMATCYCGA